MSMCLARGRFGGVGGQWVSGLRFRLYQFWRNMGKVGYVSTLLYPSTGQVGLGVGSWPSNRATEGSNPKGTRLYFVILLKNVEKIFDWH